MPKMHGAWVLVGYIVSSVLTWLAVVPIVKLGVSDKMLGQGLANAYFYFRPAELALRHGYFGLPQHVSESVNDLVRSPEFGIPIHAIPLSGLAKGSMDGWLSSITSWV